MNVKRPVCKLNLREVQELIVEHMSCYRDSLEQLVQCVRAESCNLGTTILLAGQSVGCLVLGIPQPDISLLVDSGNLGELAGALKRHFKVLDLDDEQLAIEFDDKLRVKLRATSNLDSVVSVLRLCACPFSGELQSDSQDLEDLYEGVLRVTEEAFSTDSASVLYLTLELSSRLNIWPDAVTLEALREWADRVEYSDSLVVKIGQVFKQIMEHCEYPAVGFALLKATGLRYRHFRIILNLEKELRELRWSEAISALEDVVQISKKLETPADEAIVARWIVFLQPLLEGARYVSMGDVVKDCSRRYPVYLETICSRLPIQESLKEKIARGIGLLTIIKRNTSEAHSRQTTVFRVVKTAAFLTGSTHEIPADCVVEAQGSVGGFPTVLLNSKVENKLRRFAPLPMTLTRILVKIGNGSLIYDEEFFRELELEPSVAAGN